MKLIIGITFLLTVAIGRGQTVINNDSLLTWKSERKLVWTDFKGKPKENRGIVSAETYCEVKVVKSWDDGYIPKFNIVCVFKKYDSWHVVDDDYTLKHEQLHFDMWELFTRKIRKEIKRLNEEEKIEYDEYVDEFNRLIKEGDKLSADFDYDVHFANEKQPKWAKLVADGLSELSDFQK